MRFRPIHPRPCNCPHIAPAQIHKHLLLKTNISIRILMKCFFTKSLCLSLASHCTVNSPRSPAVKPMQAMQSAIIIYAMPAWKHLNYYYLGFGLFSPGATRHVHCNWGMYIEGCPHHCSHGQSFGILFQHHCSPGMPLWLQQEYGTILRPAMMHPGGNGF